MVVLRDFIDAADFDIFENAPILLSGLQAEWIARHAFHRFSVGAGGRGLIGYFREWILEFGVV